MTISQLLIGQQNFSLLLTPLCSRWLVCALWEISEKTISKWPWIIFLVMLAAISLKYIFVEDKFIEYTLKILSSLSQPHIRRFFRHKWILHFPSLNFFAVGEGFCFLIKWVTYFSVSARLQGRQRKTWNNARTLVRECYVIYKYTTAYSWKAFCLWFEPVYHVRVFLKFLITFTFVVMLMNS